MWEDQWLSLSCQWELVIWMCVCSVVSCLIFYSSVHLLIFWTFWIFYLKSSDLSMVNPHISLNPQNPPIHGAIHRFSEDFYCEIHGFCGQSSDLVEDLSKSSGGSEGLFIYFVWVSVWHLDRLPFTQSLSVPLSLQMVFLRAGSLRTQTDLNTDLI